MKNRDKEFNRLVDAAFDNLTPEELEETRISFSVAARLHDILDAKGMTQKGLAELMGKKESEISRWLKGMHNFTTKTIAKLHVTLGEKILVVPGEVRQHTKGDLPKAMANEPTGSGELVPLQVAYSARHKMRTQAAA